MVEFNDLEYSGQEFKTNFINTLCMGSWCPDIVTSLTAMFNDMPLTKEEHLKVVNKLASYIGKLTPQELPPLVYQLLKFCRHHNGRAVFLKLQHYFGLRIYDNADFNKNRNPESPDFDIIEFAEDGDILGAESNVLFHIHSEASNGHNCIKDYLSSLKNTIKSPEFVLQPFELLALFTISTDHQYEETVFEIVRHSIVRSYNEELKKKSSYWYRDIVSSSVNPEDVFTKILDVGDRELLLEALVNFGFGLLNIGSALGRDIIAEKQWYLGSKILIMIIKKKSDVAGIILKSFCDHIVTRQSATQYIECLYKLSKANPVLMMQCSSSIVELIESLIDIPAQVANQLLDAIVLLTKGSFNIRDHYILVLRKALNSRSVETRQMAVSGFVKLISTLRISTGGVLSQSVSSSFSSGYSLYTQLSMPRNSQVAMMSTFSNEAICWEVLGMLKRCFMQQAEVKYKLYDDLQLAVSINPELCVPVLDVFWFHFVDYYVKDEETNPPLNFNKVGFLRDTDCVLQEPLGKFVFSISQIVAKAKESENDKDCPTVEKYVQVLESLCHRMSSCELVHFELDDGTDLNDILPESQQKVHILKEVISVYEGLIGYKITTLSKDGDNQCCIINSLFNAYLRFLNFGKNLSKPKKAKKNEKLSQKEGASKTSQVNQKKGDTSSKAQSKAFRSPDTLLDFVTVDRALKTLLESSVPWVSTNEANTIKTKPELHRHFIQAATCLVSKIKNHKPIDVNTQKRQFDQMTSIANTLYNRVIKRLNDYVDFDSTSAVAAVECFHTILVVVNGQYNKNLHIFFNKIGDKDKECTLTNHIKEITEEFQKLFETDEEELSNDPEVKKLSFTILNVISILYSLIPEKGNVALVQVYEWLKQYAFNHTMSNKVSGVFINLLLESHVKSKLGLSVFEQISLGLMNVIGIHVEESINEDDSILKIIDFSTANSIVQSLCTNTKAILDDCESVLARIKSDHYVLTYPGQDNLERRIERLKSEEKGVSCQLCLVANILTNLASTALTAGHLSDAVFKNIVQFYSLLSSLTKYFLARSTKNNVAFQGGWFDRLVKLTGKKLAPVVYNFIRYLDKSSEAQTQTQQPKKKTMEGTTMKSKILRETKIIPKVIYEMEQFSKCLIQLSKKTKVDLSKYVGTGTVRDFRILKLKEVLENAGGTVDTTLATQNSNANVTNEENKSDEENESVDCVEESGDDDEATPPPSKKLRK